MATLIWVRRFWNQNLTCLAESPSWLLNCCLCFSSGWAHPPPAASSIAVADPDNVADAKTCLLVKASQMKHKPPEISPVKRLSDRRTKLVMVITYTRPIYSQGGSHRMPSRHANVVRYQVCYPPIKNFKNLGDICLPEAIPKKLKEKGLAQPTPIHLQGLPAIHGLGKMWRCRMRS